MSEVKAPPECDECGSLIGDVTAEVDPQEIDVRHRAQCGHVIDYEVAHDLWKHHGYRWDIPAINGASLAAAERRRHFTDEGFTPAYDARHPATDLPWAAWAHVDAAVNDPKSERGEPPPMWPKSPEEWKVDATPVRRLVIAAALIEAEIDRLLLVNRQP